jgi:stage II sporulation protein R
MGKMLSRRQMQHLCICLALGLLLCSLWQAAAWGRTQLHTGDAVCADTLRLHIRAASDSVADQSAKLRVRDAVLAVMQQCPAQSAPEARAWAAGRLLQFQLAAQRALAAQSIRAPVRVYLVNMYFPARRYPTGQLPAGRYDAVRIDIGSGGGRNWWCVLYPGLCSFAQGGYALPAENDLVCGQYILRFRLVDWAHRLTARRQTVLLAG